MPGVSFTVAPRARIVHDAYLSFVAFYYYLFSCALSSEDNSRETRSEKHREHSGTDVPAVPESTGPRHFANHGGELKHPRTGTSSQRLCLLRRGSLIGGYGVVRLRVDLRVRVCTCSWNSLRIGDGGAAHNLP